VSARNAAVWPFITVRDSLFNARVYMYATHSGLYSLAGRPVTQIVFTYFAAHILLQGHTYRHTTLLHCCRRVLLERFFFQLPHPLYSSSSGGPRREYIGVTATATGVFRRSRFSISAARITRTENAKHVEHKQYRTVGFHLYVCVIYYYYETLVVRPSASARETKLLLSTYIRISESQYIIGGGGGGVVLLYL